MEKIRVSILGATGIVGSKFIEILNSHPYFEINRLYASENSAGKKLSEVLKIGGYGIKEDILEQRIESLDGSVTKDDSELFFSSLPTDVALKYEKELSESGKKVITNSSAFRMHQETPILIPEVNYDHINLVRGKEGFIIANGNCSTIGLVLSLAPIKNLIREVVVTTEQSISGAGYPGVSSWDILSNIIPYIEKEEEKLENESRKILGIFDNRAINYSPISIYATATRVPTLESHLGSVTVELKEEMELQEIIARYENYRFERNRDRLFLLPNKSIIVRSEVNRPQPIRDYMAGEGLTAGMPVVTGRFRKHGKKLSYIFLVNNLIRGAAGSSILNGEIVVQEGLI